MGTVSFPNRASRLGKEGRCGVGFCLRRLRCLKGNFRQGNGIGKMTSGALPVGRPACRLWGGGGFLVFTAVPAAGKDQQSAAEHSNEDEYLHVAESTGSP